MIKTSEFLAWLKARQGSAYVWGAQGQEACADGGLRLDGVCVSPSWEAWVDARETSSANAERAKAFIKKKLKAGDGNVPLFDCSGLLMRYLKDIKGYFPADRNAAGLFDACLEIKKDALAPGCLLFRHDGRTARHVGVYLGHGQAIEAQGRDTGVVTRKLGASGEGFWNRYGTLPCLAESAAYFAVCEGKSVNVRTNPGTQHGIICVAHKNELMLAAPCAVPGWHQVALKNGERLITGYMVKQYIGYREGGIEDDLKNT